MLQKNKTIIIVVLLLCVSAFFWGNAFAQEQANNVKNGYLTYQEPATTQSSWLSTISYMISLLFVFALIAGLAYFTSKFLGNKLSFRGQNKSTKILETLPLGPNKCIYVVEIAGSVMLIGVTDKEINLIKEITDEMEIEKLRVNAINSEIEIDFNNIFHKQINSLESISKRFPSLLNKRNKNF